MQSFVWGLVSLARAALRLWALLDSGVGGFVLVSVVTGMPVLAALIGWGIWHARRVFSRLDESAPEAQSNDDLTVRRQRTSQGADRAAVNQAPPP